MKFINGLADMITGADVGSLMSATQDEPDSVSKEKGPDFSILKFGWTGLEIAHLFLFASFFLLYVKKKQNTREASRNPDEDDKPMTKALVFDLGLCLLRGTCF